MKTCVHFVSCYTFPRSASCKTNSTVLPELAKYSSNCELGLNQRESHSDATARTCAKRDPREKVVRFLISWAKSLRIKRERIWPQARVVVDLPDGDLYRRFRRNEIRTNLTGLGGLSNDETHDGRIKAQTFADDLVEVRKTIDLFICRDLIYLQNCDAKCTKVKNTGQHSAEDAERMRMHKSSAS